MVRVKGAVNALKKRRTRLKMTKGYRHGRSTKERMAKDAIMHAGRYARRDRRAKKRVARSLWTVRINAGIRALGVKNYATFIDMMHKKNITVDRKVLATMAVEQPTMFERLVKQVVA